LYNKNKVTGKAKLIKIKIRAASELVPIPEN